MPDALVGAHLTKVFTAAELVDGDAFTIGQTVRDHLGRQFMFARAGAALTANLATVGITAGVAAATGGTWVAPATAVNSGEFAFFRNPAAASPDPATVVQVVTYTDHKVTPAP